MFIDIGMFSKVEGFIYFRYYYFSIGGGGKFFFRLFGLFVYYN